MSKNTDGMNYKSKEVKDDESYFYRFESILIPIIPTFIIIIAAILFNKFSPKSKMNYKKLNNKNVILKKEDDDNNKKEEKEKDNNIKNNQKKNLSNKNKGNLKGGNPRYKQEENKSKKKLKFKEKKKKNDKEILNSIIKSNFFMPLFKSIKKFKGFNNEIIEKTFNEYLEEERMEKFFLIDCYNSFNKYKPIENKEIPNQNLILVYYLDDNNKESQDIYNKNDLINDYEIIIINYDLKEIKLLFPKKRNIKKLSDNELLEEIKNSWCIKNIYEVFNINPDYKIGLSLNSIENKYNVYLVNNYITANKNNPKNKDDTDKNNNYTINNISSNNIINNNETKKENNINNKNEIIVNSNNNDDTNQNKINKNNNTTNNMNNQNTNDNNNTNNNMIYLFPLIGLNNVGSTCFMNATLQCLLHISELNLYFINEYPNDCKVLNTKNSSSESKGYISLAYFNVVKGVFNNYNNFYSNLTYSPGEFKETIGTYNSQFQFYEANDSKDLILYLLQTIHEELNYFGDQPFPLNIMRPNQENRADAFNYFMTTYNIQNFSIISKLFYGTYENTVKCNNCNKVFFSYQKFEFISFSTYNYRNGVFNIYNGFQDNEATQKLKGDNQYFCTFCQHLHEGETCCKIIQPPLKLLINIDYGKNKMFKVRRLIFEEIIDITQFVNFDFGKKILYQISGVCTHLGSSGPSGHYIAYCKNRQTGLWYNFNDSYVRQCNKDEIYNGSPYLLLYEQI